MFILFTVVLRRLVFPLVLLVIPFRGWLRNYVYNWHLQNGKPLKRLWERNPTKVTGGWALNNVHSPVKGVIAERRVNTVSYWLVLPMWLLLDDDAMADTYDAGFNMTIVKGERKMWMPECIKGRLDKAAENAEACHVVGNSFDLGDKRQECGLYEFWSVFWWTLRNPAYNFNYRFNQIVGDRYAFSFVVGGRLFGWAKDGMLSGVQCYSWEIGRKV